MVRNFLLNISTGTIHDTKKNCPYAKRMKKSNKQSFETYEQAVNYYEGEKKGEPCAYCMCEYNK